MTVCREDRMRLPSSRPTATHSPGQPEDLAPICKWIAQRPTQAGDLRQTVIGTGGLVTETCWIAYRYQPWKYARQVCARAASPIGGRALVLSAMDVGRPDSGGRAASDLPMITRWRYFATLALTSPSTANVPSPPRSSSDFEDTPAHDVYLFAPPSERPHHGDTESGARLW